MTYIHKTGEFVTQEPYATTESTPLHIPIVHPPIRRRATRFKAHGIVVLTDFKKPLITNIYDISTRGVSFWPTQEEKLTGKEFKMDILIYDAQTGFEYFISQLQGRVKYTKKMIRNPITNALVKRFGLKFIHYNRAHRTILETGCSMLFNQKRVSPRMV